MAKSEIALTFQMLAQQAEKAAKLTTSNYLKLKHLAAAAAYQQKAAPA